MDKFTEINQALDRCCELALKQPLPNKQITLMTDASFTAAGYAVLIEDDPLEKYTSTRKAYAPVTYGSKTFSPAQLKMSIYAKEFLAIFFAFKEFGHIFLGTPKPVIILTDNKSVTRFFQTKIIASTLWNACDYVIQFNFTFAHIPGKNNTAADYLSRLEISPKEKPILRIREDIPKTPIELALKHPLPNKQIALMTDASFSAAGYAVLIEDDPLEKYTSTRKAFAPVAYGSKTFSPAQLKMYIYAKDFLAIFFAFKEFGHVFGGTPKPVIILTDNKSVT